MKALRIAGIVIAGLLLAALCAHLLQRRGAQSDWEKAKAELAAKGLMVYWDDVAPPPVPDEENFFAHPVVRHLLPPKGGLSAAATNAPAPPPEIPTWEQPFTMQWLKSIPRTVADESRTNTVSLEDLREWAASGDWVVTALREANQRPRARLEGDYAAPFSCPIPDFVRARSLAQFLASRARVHLVAGDQAAAMEDLEAMEAVLRALNSPPHTLVSAMIHVAVAGLRLDVINDGLKEGLWSDASLRQIADKLAKVNLIQSMEHALRDGELAGVQTFFEDLAGPRKSKRRRDALALVGATQWTPPDLMIRAAPKTWIRRNQAVHARLMTGFIESMDGQKRRFYPDKNQAAAQSVSAAFAKWSPHTMVAALATPNFLKAGSTMIRTQARGDQTAIVCALELHKRRHGAYPESLQELTPEFISALPRDPFRGADYVYRKKGSSFVLYSVGANGKDDGGQRGEGIGPGATEDLVWTLPEEAAAAR